MISPASAIASIVTVSVAAGPAISSSRCTLPTMKNWNVPVVMPDRHAKRDRAAAGPETPDAIERPLHLPRGAACALLVDGPVEEQQQGVAAPLEQAGAVVVGLVEQRHEDAVERVPHQLRADLAAAREALGQRGEARDVDEHHRALDLPMQVVGCLPQPVDDEPRHVRRQDLVRTLT